MLDHELPWSTMESERQNINHELPSFKKRILYEVVQFNCASIVLFQNIHQAQPQNEDQ